MGTNQNPTWVPPDYGLQFIVWTMAFSTQGIHPQKLQSSEKQSLNITWINKTNGRIYVTAHGMVFFVFVVSNCGRIVAIDLNYQP